MKRFHVQLPEELYQKLQEVAEQNGTNSTELLRRFIRLGLIAVQAERSEGSALILREGDREKQLILL